MHAPDILAPSTIDIWAAWSSKTQVPGFITAEMLPVLTP